MPFSSLFGFINKPSQAPTASDAPPAQTPVASDSLRCEPPHPPKSEAIGGYRNLSEAIGAEIIFPCKSWLLPTQASWINDQWHLRIWEKSRQVGATKTDALDSVLKASPAEARFDVW